VGPISLEKLLELARRDGATLSERLVAHLFCAAVWRAAVAGAALRTWRILLDPVEGLRLDVADRGEDGEEESGYLAPEASEAPANDPQVLVYAAGALGYELLAGEPPPSAAVRVPRELSGPLGQVVRVALAPHPRNRYAALDQMSEALQAIIPTPAPDLEKLLFSSLYALWARKLSPPPAPPDEEAGAAWRSGIDAAIERIERQQLELIAALAARKEETDSNVERSSRTRQQFDQPLRIASLGMTQPPIREQARPGPSLWLTWGGATLAGALGAFVLFIALENRQGVETPKISQPVAEVRTEARPQSQPAPEAAATPVSSPPQAMVATPMILSKPKELQPADAGGNSSESTAAAEPVKETPAQPASVPPPALAPAAKRAKTRAPASSIAQALLESGERALRRGRPADALVAFRSASAADPALAPAVRGAGMAQMMQGKDREAKESFKQYLDLDPNAEDAPQIKKYIETLGAEASR